MNPFLSVIIPCYNEEKRIADTCISVAAYLKRQKFNSEVIFVNDGSTDNTEKIIRNYIAGNKNMKIIDLRENRGKGYSVRCGMLHARGDVRLFMDADNSTSIKYFDAARIYIDNGFDVIRGSRSSKDAVGAKEIAPRPWYRRFASKIGNFIIRVFVVRGIWDAHCGFKVFTKKACVDIFSRARIDGWGFDAEILLLSRILGFRVGVIPIQWRNYYPSRVTLTGYIRTLIEIVKIQKHRRFAKH